MTTPPASKPRSDIPTPDADTDAYWAAAREGRLLIARCAGCGRAHHYPRPFCPRCHCAQLRWTDVSGEATVVVSAVVSRPPWNDLPRAAPYPVVIVRLAEGPQMLSTVEHCDPASVVPGMAVRAAFERVGDIGLVRFVPAS